MAASDAAASGAVHAAVHSVTTSGTKLPTFYTYFGERGCSEHVAIMRKAWSDEGWMVQWISMLKTGSDYKVTVTYGMPDDEERSFTETIWKEANEQWKPTWGLDQAARGECVDHPLVEAQRQCLAKGKCEASAPQRLAQ